MSAFAAWFFVVGVRRAKRIGRGCQKFRIAREIGF
jgi:hypothetical protein